MQKFRKGELKILAYWIEHRDNIRERKERGESKPWTDDVVLRDHRWCNVRRMDDNVSQWMLHYWYAGGVSDRMLTAMAVLGRSINWPDSLETIMPVLHDGKWKPAEMIKRLKAHKARGNKVFTGAYIVNGSSGGDKIDIVVKNADEVWKAMRKDDREILWDRRSMRECWAKLCGYRGLGSFMAGQVVADLRYAVVGAWGDAIEWAPLGPGSARGMNRLLGREVRQPMKQKEFDVLLPALWDELMGYELMGYENASDVFDERGCEAMDLQNCLCEFDKYRRLTLGEGSVRSKYPGAA